MAGFFQLLMEPSVLEKIVRRAEGSTKPELQQNQSGVRKVMSFSSLSEL